MRSVAKLNWLPLLAGCALAGSHDAMAQSFSAGYELSPDSIEFAQPNRFGPLRPGELRVAPLIQSDAGFSGAGLSIAAGQNWFAQVAIGRSLPHGLDLGGAGSRDAFGVAGGYRWTDGKSLSLQLTARRGGNRLGLSANYDWPRYFVRLSYDQGLNPMPQDKLRFSAGMRF
jgi:hypothetical protein